MAYKPDKHGRDHCPGGEDPIPCIGVQIFQATRWNDDTTGIDTTNTNVDWDYWANGNESVFEPIGISVNPPVSGTDQIRVIRLKKAGRYTFSLRFNVESDSDIDGVEIGIHDDDDPWGYGEYYNSGPISPYNLGGWVAWTWTAIYPLMGTDTWWPDFALLGPWVPVYFTIAAISADLVTSSAALLEISYDPVSVPAGYHDIPS